MTLPTFKNVFYQPPDTSLWTGRKSNPSLGKQYWYQDIKYFSLNDSQSKVDTDIALIGYVCDEGVRRNHGRVGAKDGPTAIRERLAKLPLHHEKKQVADAGNVVCVNEGMEGCQQLLSKYVSELLAASVFPVVLGGGHDMSYGHFMGIWDVVKNTDKKRIGIINFDAHFDLRSVEERGNSGTPFYQIITGQYSIKEPIDYFAVGIQLQSNTRELFDFAKHHDVKYVLNSDCEATDEKLQSLKEKLSRFSSQSDHLYITLDLDGFSSAYAPV
jgi:formiminoglutamase